MSAPVQPSTPADRERAKSRLRTLTRGAIVAAAGATAALGIVVAHDRPGASAGPTTAGSGSTSSTSSNGSSSSGSTLRHLQLRYDRHHGEYREHRHLVFIVSDPDAKLPVADRDVGGNVAVTQGTGVIEPVLTTRSFRAIGTTATVVVQEPGAAEEAEQILAGELAAFDLACSRFRPDSELESVHANAGRTVAVSALLFEALSVACDVAERTGGAVDPTIGNAIVALGYDADLDEVQCTPARPAAGARTRGGLPARAAQSARPHRPHPARRPSRPGLVRQGIGRRPGGRPHCRTDRHRHPREPRWRRRRRRPTPGGRVGRGDRP